MTRVLFLCTGNVCRSAIAQHVLHARLGHPEWVEIVSAGTRAPAGHAMAPEAVILAREFGARGPEAAHHRARPVTPPLVDGAGLVLAMTRAHRRTAVELAPRRLRASYTIREFARLTAPLPRTEIRALAAGDDPGTRLRSLVAALADRRGAAAQAGSPESDDVLDPFGKDDEAYRACARVLMPAIDAVERALRLAGP